jgi:hypothetical protein
VLAALVVLTPAAASATIIPKPVAVSAQIAARATDVASASDSSLALHLLNRATFGARPGDLARVLRIGIDAWVEQQLNSPPASANTLTSTPAFTRFTEPLESARRALSSTVITRLDRAGSPCTEQASSQLTFRFCDRVRQ